MAMYRFLLFVFCIAGMKSSAQWLQVYGQKFHENESFSDVANPQPNHYICVGGNGVIYSKQLDYGYWDNRYIFSNTNSYLSAIQFLTDRVGFIVGYGSVILKTTDGGYSWNKLINDLPDAGLKSVCFTDELHGCVCANEGIFYTEDGGHHFTKSYESAKNEYLNKIILNRQGVGFTVGLEYASSTMQLLKTKDGGKTWKDAGVHYTGQLTDIHFISNDRILAIGPQRTVMSTDGGSRWSLTENAKWWFEKFNVSDNPWELVAVGKDIDTHNGTIFYSNDGGRSWIGKSNSGDRNYNSLNNVVFGLDKKWILVGHGSTFKKTDREVTVGDDFTEKDNEKPNYIWFSVVNYNKDVAFVAGLREEDSHLQHSSIMRTINGGQNWELVELENNNGKTNNGIRGFDLNEYRGLFAAGSNGKVVQSSNARDWEQVMDEKIFPGLLRDVLIDKSSDVFVVGEKGFFAVSRAPGEEWQTKVLKPNRQLAQLYETPGGKLIITGDSGTILLSEDHGKTFTDHSVGNYHLRGISFSDALHGVIVGEHCTVLYTKDGGYTWTPSSITNPHNFLSSVAFRTSKEVYAVGDKGAILFSKDGGISWERIIDSRFFDTWLTDVYFKDPDHGWLIGDKGIIYKYQTN